LELFALCVPEWLLLEWLPLARAIVGKNAIQDESSKAEHGWGYFIFLPPGFSHRGISDGRQPSSMPL
jgi:hypothetical protein